MPPSLSACLFASFLFHTGPPMPATPVIPVIKHVNIRARSTSRRQLSIVRLRRPLSPTQSFGTDAHQELLRLYLNGFLFVQPVRGIQYDAPNIVSNIHDSIRSTTTLVAYVALSLAHRTHFECSQKVRCEQRQLFTLRLPLSPF